MVADLRQSKGKISGCFQNSTSIFLQQFQNKVSSQREGSSVVLNFFLNLGLSVLSIHKRTLSTLKKCRKDLNAMPEPFL